MACGWKFFLGGVGAFNSEAINQFREPNILELGCADGFYAYYFYRHISGCSYLGVDLDERGLAIANKRFKGSKFEAIRADFLNDLPDGDFTNVLWCESINMFVEKDQKKILIEVAKRLSKTKGILSGTGVLQRNGEEQWKYYCGLWESVEYAYSLLKEFFNNVYIYTRGDISGIAVYFMASDGELPCGDGCYYIEKR